MSNEQSPRAWLAAVIGLVSPWLGMLYVGRPGWSLAYFVGGLCLGLVAIFLPSAANPTDMLLIGLNLAGSVQAYRLAKRWPAGQVRRWFSRWYGLIGAVLVIAATAIGLRAFAFEPFKQPSGSMLPTLKTGTPFWVKKWGYGNYATFGIHLARRPISAPLVRGDVIVFEYPEDRSIHFVKRIVGMPGDVVRYRGHTMNVNGEDAQLHRTSLPLNGEVPAGSTVFKESFGGKEHLVVLMESAPPISLGMFGGRLPAGCNMDGDSLTCRVPEGHYFVLGDNRDNSRDSRYWGFVPADHVVGPVLLPSR